jgi:predicted DNA-binding transcriptional regulator AlpA
MSSPVRPRASRVIRLHDLPAYLGVQRSQIDVLIKEGKLHPFSITGRRAKCVTEDEIVRLQEAAKAAAQGKVGDADA